MPTRIVVMSSGDVWPLRDDARSYRAESIVRGYDGKQRALEESWQFAVNSKGEAYVTLRESWISSHHGAISFHRGQWWVKDGCSTNTVSVNGQMLEAGGKMAIDDGDIIEFGQTKLRFETTGRLEREFSLQAQTSGATWTTPRR
ncbi:MAG: FHA domain-containing protein [Myxococcota bacterium]